MFYLDFVYFKGVIWYTDVNQALPPVLKIKISRFLLYGSMGLFIYRSPKKNNNKSKAFIFKHTMYSKHGQVVGKNASFVKSNHFCFVFRLFKYILYWNHSYDFWSLKMSLFRQMGNNSDTFRIIVFAKYFYFYIMYKVLKQLP